MKNHFEIGKNQRNTTICLMAVAGSVLLSLAAAWMTFERLVPCGPISIHSHRSRAGWYLSSGHWKADVRTLIAAVEYVLTPDMDSEPGILPAITLPVATLAPPPTPR